MVLAILLRNKKALGFASVFVTTFLFIFSTEPRNYDTNDTLNNIERFRRASNLLIFQERPLEKDVITKWLNSRASNSTHLSKLGELLFLNGTEPHSIQRNVPKKDKFQILVWKYGKFIEDRHLKHFSGTRVDPFEHCSVNNCDITYNEKAIETADIVILHLHRFKGKVDLPKRLSQEQIWTFLTDESPYHTFLNNKNNKLSEYNGIFNWSMHYRMDADIPVPYGRTIVKSNPEPYVDIKIEKRRDVLVAIMGSNCGGINHRWQYVKELQKHISVDIYGGCGPLKKSCPGHFKADCPVLFQYLFYLSFENANCEEYVTEKLWWNAFNKNSIPVVMGSSRKGYEKLLPPSSYINTDDFANPAALAQYLLLLNKTEDFKSYYRWKANFEVLNEHGYFKSRSYHYCRICQALNFNSRKSKVYNNLEEYWDKKKYCYPAWDSWNQ